MIKMQLRVTGEDGKKSKITGIDRDDWNGLSEPCPECGDHEFDHFEASGGHYGKHEQTVIERTDYWSGTRSLFTQCKSCGEVLFKHPAFDLLFDLEGDDDAVIEM